MTRQEALIALNLTMDIGSRRLNKLLEVFGSPEKIFKASSESLSRVDGIGAQCCRKVSGFTPAEIEREISLARARGITIVTLYDGMYPKNLTYTLDNPIVLYVRGTLVEDDRLGIAMVGCRTPSFYGIEQSRIFAGEFARRGITVISGLARGIDTCSHEGALKAGGRTIAVIGSGLCCLYPPENEQLAQRIASAGAVISEFPMEACPKRQNFPRRNRVISGLSLGVLVVEAGRNSGSLITAHLAAEQGRDVFALPGKVDVPQAFGTNYLIKEGACLVSRAEDILDTMPFLYLNGNAASLSVKTPKLHGQGLSCIETVLYNIITCRPVHKEVLAEETGMDISGLSSILMSLQIKKMIEQVSPGIFIRSKNVS